MKLRTCAHKVGIAKRLLLVFAAALSSWTLKAEAGQPGGATPEPVYSKLWGKAGEQWTPAGRLPDYSYAGYRHGEKPLPRLPVKANVRAFGARGDGKTDDTEAFRRALAGIKEGVLLVPEGRYLITGVLDLNRNEFVLRGAGPGKTVLYCPRTMDKMVPSRKNKKSWAFDGGVLWLRGKAASGSVPGPVKVTARAKRGARSLQVAAARSLKAGMVVQLTMTDPEDSSLFRHFYAGGSTSTMFKGRPIVSFVSRIEAVRGSSVVLERPLRLNVELAWKPVLKAYRPAITESGIEDLSIEFPAVKHMGHFTGPYYNAICLSKAAHCWVRNVKITNAYYGVRIGGKFCTVQGLVLDSNASKSVKGHHGICPYGDDNLITEFNVRTTFIHDLCVTWAGAGNVYSNGKGRGLNFDHHRAGPYENLFTNIDVAGSKRLWASGGSKGRGRNAAARNTYWNIRARKPLKLPRADFGVVLNFVLHTAVATSTSGKGRWVEPVEPGRLHPANLHEAQLERRLKGRK